ncbi:hypothetical protein [Vagococcus salmoninarum]|uniref:Uncharacterized protein n=1 Tax=Vagococcus salmoninarum TaxID=2739 RepID=A0A429ZUU5_9ENTE|nr:hypothetical protein [Vagococcus salmoninarum]MBE9388126.1 hypothetical protein [Vagococcus salmoninarum]RST97413.1 hypothetical protein CBF35_01730 [Vagococcus salmoninarum]
MIPLGERLLKVVIAENVERYRLEIALSKRELADQDDYFLLFRVVISITNVAKAIISDMASNTVTLTPFVKSLSVILAF